MPPRKKQLSQQDDAMTDPPGTSPAPVNSATTADSEGPPVLANVNAPVNVSLPVSVSTAGNSGGRRVNPNISDVVPPHPDNLDASFYAPNTKKFYPVSRGTVLGVHGSWLSANAAVNGQSGATHEGFKSFEDAAKVYSDEYFSNRWEFTNPSPKKLRQMTVAAKQKATAPSSSSTQTTTSPTPQTSRDAPSMLTLCATPPSAQELRPRLLFPASRPDLNLTEGRVLVPATPSPPPLLSPVYPPGHAKNPIYYSPSPTPAATPGRAANPIPVPPTSSSADTKANAAPGVAGPSAEMGGTVAVPKGAKPVHPKAGVTGAAPTTSSNSAVRHFCRPGFIPNRGGAPLQSQGRINPASGRHVVVEVKDSDTESDEGQTDGRDPKEDGSDKEAEENVGGVASAAATRDDDEEQPADQPQVYVSVGVQTRTVFLLSALNSAQSSPSQATDGASSDTDSDIYATATESSASDSGSPASVLSKRKSPEEESESGPRKRPSPGPDGLTSIPATPLGPSRFVPLFPETPVRHRPPQSATTRPHSPPGHFSPTLLNLQHGLHLAAQAAAPAHSPFDSPMPAGQTDLSGPSPATSDGSSYSNFTDYGDPGLFHLMTAAVDKAAAEFGAEPK